MDILGGFRNAMDALDKVKTAESKAELLEQIDKVRAGFISAQDHIIGLQSERADLRKQVEALEVQIAKVESWAVEAAKYRLVAQESGVLVYEPRSIEAGEAPHSLCTTCFENGRKSFLQVAAGAVYWDADDRYRKKLFCPTCKLEVSFGVLPLAGIRQANAQAMAEYDRRRGDVLNDW